MADAPFTRGWLRGRGFMGFERFHDLDLECVPDKQGVYVLLREAAEPPRFLEYSPAGRFKQKDPTQDIAILRSRWINDAHCIYIGKADYTSRTNLRKRLRDFRDFGGGAPIGHWGGRYVWQLSDALDYVVAWMVTEDPPIEVESRLVDEFEQLHRQLPFGNIKRPHRRK